MRSYFGRKKEEMGADSTTYSVNNNNVAWIYSSHVSTSSLVSPTGHHLQHHRAKGSEGLTHVSFFSLIAYPPF